MRLSPAPPDFDERRNMKRSAWGPLLNLQEQIRSAMDIRFGGGRISLTGLTCQPFLVASLEPFCYQPKQHVSIKFGSA